MVQNAVQNVHLLGASCANVRDIAPYQPHQFDGKNGKNSGGNCREFSAMAIASRVFAEIKTRISRMAARSTRVSAGNFPATAATKAFSGESCPNELTSKPS
jgi:hypothetical protein